MLQARIDMERPKLQSDYASDYKFRRTSSTSEKRAHRLQRRSLDWKEQRGGAIDKRRKIVEEDLSPVQEGNITRDKSYKEKTPSKPKGDASNKGLSRMEMLKKWKAERAMKRQEVKKDNGSVFRVSKAMEYRDRQLFQSSTKSRAVKAQAVAPIVNKPHPAKVIQHSTTSKHTAKVDKHPTVRKETRSQHAPAVATATTRQQTNSRTKPIAVAATRASRGAPVALTHGIPGQLSDHRASHHRLASTKQQPECRPVNTRTSARLAAKSHIEPKVTRQTAKSTVAPGKAAEQTKAKPQLSLEPQFAEDSDLNLTKVNTRRGGFGESFAANDFTFTAPSNVSSFMFKPMSPASAANFLYPNQDTSQVSFMETKSRPCSTPKAVGDDSHKKTRAYSVFVASDDENQTEHVTQSSPSATRRSLRRSVATLCDDSESTNVDKTIVNPAPVEDSPVPTPARQSRRSLRRSVVTNESVEQGEETTVEADTVIVAAIDDGRQATPGSKRRRSLRRSVVTNESMEQGEETTVEVDTVIVAAIEDGRQATPGSKRRRSLRRSVVTNESVEQGEETTVEADTVIVAAIDNGRQATPGGKRRRSLRKSLLSLGESTISDSSDVASDENVSNSNRSTPSRQRTRSLRKSIAVVPDLSSILEVGKGGESDTVSSDSLSDSQKPTPSKRVRRSTRRSITLAESVTGTLVCASSDDSGSVFNESADTNDKLTGDVGDGNNNSSCSDTAGKISDSGIWEDRSMYTKTPATAPGKRRSFAVPDSDSLVLSGKRLPKRNNMPKSPEEWVDLLNGSPMVEMTRRTPKPTVVAETLNFDDVDMELLEDANRPSSTSVLDPVVDDGMPSTSAELVANGSFIEESCEVSEPVVAVTSPAVGNGPRKSSENVQVEEISSTREGPLSNEEEEPVHNVKYFRRLLISETSRFNDLCEHWTAVNDSTPDIAEEMRGQLRTTVGQAHLLMNQRFRQFSGLVDDCDFGRGEKETTFTDLQGFWDMIYFQVEDVNAKFADLTKLEANNWVDDKPKPVVKKTKKKVAKTTKPAGKSKFASFRAQIKKQAPDGMTSPALVHKQEAKVFEMPAFFQVTSPVRSPRSHCEGGTPKKSGPDTPTPPSSGEVTKPMPPTVVVESSSQDILIERTPARKSYVPAVPSPLLVDSTPQPRLTRRSMKKTPLPKRLLEPEAAVASLEGDSTEQEPVVHTDSPRKAKSTPRRRSLRVRKSVNFEEEPASVPSTPAVPSSPDVMNVSPEEFARFLQPMAPQQDNAADDNDANISHDSFSKYLQPSGQLDTSIEKENSPEPKRRRHTSSLKPTKSSEKRRRSCSRNVHFFSPSTDETSHPKMPITPYNRDSLVKPKRRSRRSHSASSPVVHEDVFDIENIDEDSLSVNMQPYRSSRPSLLYTPPKRNALKVAKHVPTATLISFSP